MTIESDRARLARFALWEGGPLYSHDAAFLLRMARQGIAAREAVARVEAVCELWEELPADRRTYYFARAKQVRAELAGPQKVDTPDANPEGWSDDAGGEW